MSNIPSSSSYAALSAAVGPSGGISRPSTSKLSVGSGLGGPPAEVLGALEERDAASEARAVAAEGREPVVRDRLVRAAGEEHAEHRQVRRFVADVPRGEHQRRSPEGRRRR